MTAETYSQIASFIWSICNLLRGPYKRNEYRKVILPLTVLRRFDCILEPTKAKVLKEHAAIKAKGENITSVDYTPDTEMSRQFFATVQNKMHWAAHGQTAAEVIHARADAALPFMGLQTTRPGGVIRREDVSIAKNYLNAEELGTLNRIVNAYIEFAELRALQRQVMTMRDWIAKLDDFLKLSEHELLDHAGKITAEQAKLKAELEYDRYRALMDAQPRRVDLDFEKAVADLKKLPKPAKPKRKKGGQP